MSIKSAIEIVNIVRNSASSDYQKSIPYLTRKNFSDVANPILEYSVFQNEFIEKLFNKVFKTIVNNKILSHPLGILKRNGSVLGYDIEEISVDRAKAYTFDGKTSNLLTIIPPSVDVCYHRLNRKDQYKVSVSRNQIAEAFTSFEKLDEFFTQCINSLYNGNIDDEFLIVKNLFGTSIAKRSIKSMLIPDISTQQGKEEMLIALKTINSYFNMPSRLHNVSGQVEQTPADRLLLIIRADVLARLDVGVLSNTFNLSKADFENRTVAVDNFGQGGENTLAMIVDERAIIFEESQNFIESFYDASTLCNHSYLNVWQTFSMSPFKNGYALVTEQPTYFTKGDNETVATVEYETYKFYYVDNDKKPVEIEFDDDYTVTRNGTVIEPLTGVDSFYIPVNAETGNYTFKIVTDDEVKYTVVIYHEKPKD